MVQGDAEARLAFLIVPSGSPHIHDPRLQDSHDLLTG